LPCGHQSYIVGQDQEGHWLAVETHGLGGGIFRSRADAIHFAQFESDHDPDAVRFSSEPVSFSFAKAPLSDIAEVGGPRSR
jgi:hypothetical protein